MQVGILKVFGGLFMNNRNFFSSNTWHLVRYALIAFVGSGISFYAIIEIFNYFGFDFISIIKSIKVGYIPLLLFALISMIIAIGTVVIEMNKKYNELEQKYKDVLSFSNTEQGHNDSILNMLSDAQANLRWNEIIKIGSALSDVFWFTGRKELRIQVGRYVETAARQTHEYEVLASTLIEDLGNTLVSQGSYDEGVVYIKKGIKVAEDHDFYFLIARGYRNLACSYCAMKKVDSAVEAYEKSVAAIENITQSEKKQEAIGSTEYANVKILRLKNDYDGAIEALDKAIDAYETLSNEHPETKHHNQDRIVKMLREKGIVYLEKNDENASEMAYESFQEGLQLAQETNNFDNIVITCTNIAKIWLKKGNSEMARSTMRIAERVIDNVDTPAVRDGYYSIMERIRHNGN